MNIIIKQTTLPNYPSHEHITTVRRFDDILTTFDQNAALLNYAAMMQTAINNKVSYFNCTGLSPLFSYLLVLPPLGNFLNEGLVS